MLPSHEFQDSIKLMHIFINPDPAELILQPGREAGCARRAVGTRRGPARPPPRRAAAPARWPSRGVRSSSRADGRPGAGPAFLPLVVVLPLLLLPVLLRRPSRAPAGGFQSRPRPPQTRRGGGAGGASAKPAARAHWTHPARHAPDAKGAERAAEVPEGPAGLAPRCRGGEPLAGKGAPVCRLECWEEGLSSRAAPPRSRARLVSGSRVERAPRAARPGPRTAFPAGPSRGPPTRRLHPALFGRRVPSARPPRVHTARHGHRERRDVGAVHRSLPRPRSPVWADG